MLRGSGEPVHSLEKLLDCWLASLGVSRSSPAASGLHSRACLVWMLASITKRSPVAGYCGLLAGSDRATVPRVVAAALAAGVQIASPSESDAWNSWHITEHEGHYSIQSPNAGGPSLGQALASVQRLDMGRPASCVGVRVTGSESQPAAHFDTGLCAGSERTVMVDERPAMLSESGSSGDAAPLILRPSGAGPEVGVSVSAADEQEASDGPSLVTVEAGGWRIGVSRADRLSSRHTSSKCWCALQATTRPTSPTLLTFTRYSIVPWHFDQDAPHPFARGVQASGRA